jgi:SAM-dependent methyltransferase
MDAPALLLCLALVFAVLATPAFRQSGSPSSTAAAKPFDAAHAAVYDRIHYDGNRNKFELAFLAPPADATVLDVGCGLGHHVAALPCDAVGLDLSRAMVEAASARYPARTFAAGDALHRGAFASETFTHVMCLHTVYYFPRKDVFFQNAHYWLKPGGTLMLQLTDALAPPARPNTRADFSYRGTLTGPVFRERIAEGGVTRTFEHRLYHESAAVMLKIAKDCGFKEQASAPYEGGHLYLLKKTNF